MKTYEGEAKEVEPTRAEKMARALDGVDPDSLQRKLPNNNPWTVHYDPEMCETVKRMGRAGKSKVQMAVRLGIHRATLYRWINDIPEFREAMEMAIQYSQAWWENEGQKALHKKSADFPARLWEKNMACRFPWDYREKHEVAVHPDLPRLEQAELSPDEAYLRMLEAPKEEDEQV